MEVEEAGEERRSKREERGEEKVFPFAFFQERLDLSLALYCLHMTQELTKLGPNDRKKPENAERAIVVKNQNKKIEGNAKKQKKKKSQYEASAFGSMSLFAAAKEPKSSCLAVE